MWTGESLLARRPHVDPGPLTVVSLQPPRDESLNGLLQGYRIYYRELEYEAASATESKTLKTPSALRAELTGEPSPPPARAGSREVPVTTVHPPPRPGPQGLEEVRLCPLPPPVCTAQGVARCREQRPPAAGGPGRLPGGGSICGDCRGKRMLLRM